MSIRTIINVAMVAAYLVALVAGYMFVQGRCGC